MGSCVIGGPTVLIAYIDEFGHPGPFISSDHKKYGHHPVFGFAGFIIPAHNAREFSAYFKRERDALFKPLLEQSESPNQFEKKGNEFFSTGSMNNNPGYSRVFRSILKKLYRLEGKLFYYGDEKLVGTVKQTDTTSAETAQAALKESINRICRHAHVANQDVLIIADSITDKTRREMAAQMYAHIYSRSTTHIEMRRIVEVPLHIESKLNTNIQFADWICAAISRASHYQLARDSEFAWAAKLFGDDFHGHFTHESKLHTRVNEAEVHHSELFQETRPRFPQHNLRAIGSQHPQLQKFYDTLRTQTTTEFSENPQ